MQTRFEFGDILWGIFSADDGAGRLTHPALVIGVLNADGTALTVLGTSKRVGIASADGQVVLNPARAEKADWYRTRLAGATGFDSRRGRLLIVRPNDDVAVIGTIAKPPKAAPSSTINMWRRAAVDAGRIAIERVRRHAQRNTR